MQLLAPLVLPSQSPRRRHLLSQIGFAFTVYPSPIEEIIPPGAAPAEVVEVLALQKAESVAEIHPEALTLGADTIVELDGQILGKPTDADDARRMLRLLQGATNTVYTGIALVHPATGRQACAHEVTAVTFAPMTEDEIDAYVATGSPMDKAGAYGIQDDRGALFIQGIEGDFYNVVGLPLHRLYRLLRTDFMDLLPPHA